MRTRAHYCRLRRTALIALVPAMVLIGCTSLPPSSPVTSSPTARSSPSKASASPLPVLPPAGSGRGGYYMDDGPGDNPPEGLLDTPDAEPQVESYSPRANRPYVVFGKKYTPITHDRPFKQRGIGSWYGKKFHGQKTSSGERYDMYKMTAAHPTLPIPSYARVTNIVNGKQVIVRVNDRGPFHAGRIIDLSYTAALKLGYLAKGSGQLEVERLLPADIARIASEKKEQRARAEQATPAAEVLSDPAAVQTAAAGEIVPATVTQTLNGSSSPVTIAAAPAGAAPGFYLQLGAYAKEANAEAARTRLRQSASEILAPIDVVEQGTMYRLYSGPFATQAEAAAAAVQLRERGTFKPMIVQR